MDGYTAHNRRRNRTRYVIPTTTAELVATAAETLQFPSSHTILLLICRALDMARAGHSANADPAAWL